MPRFLMAASWYEGAVLQTLMMSVEAADSMAARALARELVEKGIDPFALTSASLWITYVRRIPEGITHHHHHLPPQVHS